MSEAHSMQQSHDYCLNGLALINRLQINDFKGRLTGAFYVTTSVAGATSANSKTSLRIEQFVTKNHYKTWQSLNLRIARKVVDIEHKLQGR